MTELVSCECGARLSAAAIVTNDHRCPSCDTRLHRCVNPQCLAWSVQLRWAADGCPECEMPGDAIADLRTGRRMLRDLRHDPRIPIPRLDSAEADA